MAKIKKTDTLVAEYDLSGFSAEDIDVTLKYDTLNVDAFVDEEDDGNYVSRSFSAEVFLDDEDAEAVYSFDENTGELKIYVRE